MGAAMAYGQACSVLEAFEDAQVDAFPMSAQLVQEWRGIHAAALAELRDIGAERAALRQVAP
jgi:hypothetical protein